jgi:choline dehydrogenase-like flavoprotein
MDYDVIVAGANPGGFTAAYELACRGVRVGLFEQKRLPRHEPCGGCRSLTIDQILEAEFRPLVERTVNGATFTFKWLDEFDVRSERPVAYMVMRDGVDHFLAEKARRSGYSIFLRRHNGSASQPRWVRHFCLLHQARGRPEAPVHPAPGGVVRGDAGGPLCVPPAERPYHRCERSRLMTLAARLTTVVVLRKCCRVDDPKAPWLPALPRRAVNAEIGE